jgi:hypothetical protein
VADHVAYYDYEESRTISCGCGWHGAANQASVESYNELFDVSCPECNARLLIVVYPTADETRRAAAANDPRATETLRYLDPGDERRAGTDHVT